MLTALACADQRLMASPLRQTSHSAMDRGFLPLSFFVAVSAIFFHLPLLGLVWTSGPTWSDRNQHQTRSRTRHRNLTRLVSYVLLGEVRTINDGNIIIM